MSDVCKTIAVVLVAAASAAAAQPAEISSKLQVINPTGARAIAHNPPCGAITDLSRLVRDRNFQKAVGEIFGPEGGAATVIIGELSKLVDTTGGSFTEYFRAGQGNDRFSTCAVICAQTPPNTWLKSINLSDSRGRGHVNVGPNGTPENLTGLYSAWTNVVSARDSSGATTVCSEAKNWSHIQTATMKLSLDYVRADPGGSCARYSRFSGTSATAGAAPWKSELVFSSGTHTADNGSGGQVSGTFNATCYSDMLLITSQNSNNTTSNCYGSLSNGAVDGFCVTNGGASKWTGQLR